MIAEIYKPGVTIVHRLDPRPKVVVLLALVIVFFLPVPFLLLVPYIALLCLTITLSIGLKEMVKPILAILPLLILVLILTPLLYKGGDPILVFRGWVIVTTSGIEDTGRLILRFTGITLAFYQFFRTTELNRFISALRWYGLPYNPALIVTTSMRYIPYVARVYGNVRDAHRLRQNPDVIESKSKGPIKRFKDTLPILTSVLICAIKGVPTLAMALEIRGVGRSNKRTSYMELGKTGQLIRDSLLSLLVILVLILPLLIFTW
jgi:energy-coupling factor transport system permease protein